MEIEAGTLAAFPPREGGALNTLRSSANTLGLAEIGGNEVGVLLGQDSSGIDKGNGTAVETLGTLMGGAGVTTTPLAAEPGRGEAVVLLNVALSSVIPKCAEPWANLVPVNALGLASNPEGVAAPEAVHK